MGVIGLELQRGSVATQSSIICRRVWSQYNLLPTTINILFVIEATLQRDVLSLPLRYRVWSVFKVVPLVTKIKRPLNTQIK